MKDESTTSAAVRDGDRVSAAKQQRAAKSREGQVHAEPNPSGIIRGCRYLTTARNGGKQR